ncbi:MAG TPA: hypothetical protein VI248_27945 [Kineosporiaceae bacterium]
MSTDVLPRAATRHELSLLRFPDPRTRWVVVITATAHVPVDDLGPALRRLAGAVPLTAARLLGERWVPGAPAEPIVTAAADPLDDPRLTAAFDLTAEPPLRVLVTPDGRRLGLAAHHAAFDGLAGVAVLDALTGGPLPAPVTSPAPGRPGSPLPLVRRLFRPADPVAPSRSAPAGDVFVVRPLSVRGREITGRLASACAAGCGAHTRAAGQPWRQVGITVALGGPAGVGNVASYVRLDLRADADVRRAVVTAMADPPEPVEQVRAPKAVLGLLSPVVRRFSDSLLVSNLGRHRLAGVDELAFFPVARGRSGVAFGAASVAGGSSTLTIRCAQMSERAATELLEEAIRRFDGIRA